jgi:hypothetical protein
MRDPRNNPAIEGSCLCGAVRLAAARKPRTVTQCNCSVCRRYGVLWAYYRRRAVAISAPRGGLETYSTRPRGLRFVRCAECGCITSWQKATRKPDDWLALNARLFDHALIANVSVSVLDGDKTWRVVDKYKKPAMFISPAHD